VKLRLPANETLIRVACLMALVALPLMVWSVFSPTVWPVLVALSVGQGIGTLSFVLFLVVVARDLGVKKKLATEEDA
jgi:preprotein translocase subunit SecF